MKVIQKPLLLLLFFYSFGFEVWGQNIPNNPNLYNQNGKRIGKWTIGYNKNWEETNNRDSISYYRLIQYNDEGIPSAKVYDYYISGQMQFEGFMQSVEPIEVMDSTCIWYYENGQIQKSANYKNGKLNGLQKSWFSNGILKEEEFYIDNQKEGWCSYFNKNGKSYVKIYFKKDLEIEGYGDFVDDTDSKLLKMIKNKTQIPGQVYTQYTYKNGETEEGLKINNIQEGIWKSCKSDSCISTYYENGQEIDLLDRIDSLIANENGAEAYQWYLKALELAAINTDEQLLNVKELKQIYLTDFFKLKNSDYAKSIAKNLIDEPLDKNNYQDVSISFVAYKVLLNYYGKEGHFQYDSTLLTINKFTYFLEKYVTDSTLKAFVNEIGIEMFEESFVKSIAARLSIMGESTEHIKKIALLFAKKGYHSNFLYDMAVGLEPQTSFTEWTFDYWNLLEPYFEKNKTVQETIIVHLRKYYFNVLSFEIGKRPLDLPEDIKKLYTTFILQFVKTHRNYFNENSNVLFDFTFGSTKHIAPLAHALDWDVNMLWNKFKTYSDNLNKTRYSSEEYTNDAEKAVLKSQKDLEEDSKKNGKHSPYRGFYLFTHGMNLFDANRIKEAEENYVKGIDNFKDLSDYILLLPESKAMNLLDVIQKTVINTVKQCFISTNNCEYLYKLSLIEKGLLLNNLMQVRQTILKNSDSLLRKKLSKYIALEEQKLTFSQQADKIDEIEKEQILLWKEIHAQTKIAKEEIVPSDIKKSLNKSEVVIDIIESTNELNDTTQYYAIILSKTTNLKIVPLLTQATLSAILEKGGKDQTERYKERGGGPTNTASYSNSAAYSVLKYLSKEVWEKIQANIPDNIKTIYFSPTGLLNTVPFAAIPLGGKTADSSQTLSQKYKLIQLLSTRSVVQQNDSLLFDKNMSFALYGNIDFGKSADKVAVPSTSLERSNFYNETRNGSWGKIEGTKSEIENIATLLRNKNVQDSQLIIKEDTSATEASFKNLGKTGTSPDGLQFATHAYTLASSVRGKQTISQNPLLKSGLIFSNGNVAWTDTTARLRIPTENDGILTAEEIKNTNLLNTKYAVLSACETGLGEIKGSEGVFGLQRAFKMAGVKYIIATLWRVPDEQTAEFWKIFYTHWTSQKIGSRTAFLKTQREMQAKCSNPYFWAAFTMVE